MAAQASQIANREEDRGGGGAAKIEVQDQRPKEFIALGYAEVIEKAIGRIAEAYQAGVIGKYAIGGAIGAMFYMEPFATKDLDIFTFLPSTPAGLVSLERVYDFFRALGYRADGQYLIVEGVRLEFIPPPTALVAEAVEKAVTRKVGRIRVRVLRPEYLAAIMLETGRRIDFARLERFLEQVKFDRRRLMRVLRSHQLLGKWRAFLKE